ncbi:hypothetical protein ACA910_001335 [Epithemia clementina (nom. ined.)]
MWSKISHLVDGWIGGEGSLGYVVIMLIVVVGYSLTSSWIVSDDKLVGKNSAQKEGEDDPPRNFTVQQLRYFDGTKDPKTEKDKPVYLSVNGYVFDVSEGRDFYGPDGPYEKFAGRECGIALAKMSFDEEHLDNVEGCASLNLGEKNQLNEWYEKFKYYRPYPEKGRLVPDSALPDPNRILSIDFLAQYSGTATEIPEGYATAPVYIGAGDKVYDVSFGGLAHYGPGGPYHKFAGRDVGRALAKMSLDDEDIASRDTSDLDENQLATLKDWIKTFEERKGYPIVGRLKSP